MSLIRRIVGSSFWSYALFWSWNLIFAAFVLLGFTPLILFQLIFAVTSGTVPPIYFVVGVSLVLIPIAAMVLGITVFRRSPPSLFALAYGVEWPLMFILALRFFVLRDSTPGMAIIISIAVLGMATLLWQLLDRSIETRSLWLTVVRAIGLTLLLVVYLYAALWLAFYAVPLAVGVVRGLVEWIGMIVRAIAAFKLSELLTMGVFTLTFVITGGSLLLFTATLLIITPIAVPILAVRSWRRAFEALGIRIGRAQALGVSAAVALVCVVLVVWTNQQHQGAAYALLKNPPATRADAQAIAAQEDKLRAGLVNSYLAQYRYISAVGEVRHVADLYQYLVGLPLETANGVEALYEWVARPLLYEPMNPPTTDKRVDGQIIRQESTLAANLYKAYFDERIVDGEHSTIASAVRSTWSGTEAEAALQDVDDRKIHLDRQEITITEHGDWAEVELFEVYQNQTMQRQEVVYYFNLPESAVITGVWLGNSEDRNARFAFHVAPRGAAQAVYQHEVRRNVDPALVEQIGPRQYRLRVFPIEPRRWSSTSSARLSSLGGGLPETEAAPPMYMWLTYSVMAQNNAWPLPQMAEKRSVYWDAQTVRRLNGRPVSVADKWLADTAPVITPFPTTVHSIQLPTGESVVAQPVSASDVPKLPANVRLAVVLDRSRSVRAVDAQVKSALARLSTIPNVDVYLGAANYRGEPPTRVKLSALDREHIEYVGGQKAGELLAQYESLRAGAEYDAIIVLTDGAGYELGESSVKPPVPNAPVWMVHLGDRLPLGYDDATLEAIQASGGSATSNVEEALNRIAFAMNQRPNATADWVDGYTWVVTRPVSGTTTNLNGDTTFAALGARRVILDAMYRERTNLHQLSTLDQLHATALKYQIVTPFSSMLVLVNAQQEQLLKQMEQQGDRFEREVEGVGDTQQFNAMNATGVPEPHEWLLIGLAVAMLAVYAFRHRLPTRRTA